MLLPFHALSLIRPILTEVELGSNTRITMKFAYTILYVQDVGRLLFFYESAFGLQRRFLRESGMYGELETGSTTLAFGSEAAVTDESPNTSTK